HKLIFGWLLGKLEVDILHRLQPLLGQDQCIASDALGIGGSKRTDAHTILLAKGNSFDRHLLYAPLVLVIYHIATMGTELALNIEAKLAFHLLAQLHRDQMEGLLMHWAVFNGVDRPIIQAAVGFQSAL